ncbi:hypothetical protein [Kribbella endophytica]
MVKFRPAKASRPLGYETTDPGGYEWTLKAYAMLVDGTLKATVSNVDDVLVAVIEGTCPRCGDHFSESRVLEAPLGTAGTLGPGGGVVDQYEVLNVSCGCTATHPGGPAGSAGCGVYFRIDALRPQSGGADG